MEKKEHAEIDQRKKSPESNQVPVSLQSSEARWEHALTEKLCSQQRGYRAVLWWHIVMSLPPSGKGGDLTREPHQSWTIEHQPEEECCAV